MFESQKHKAQTLSQQQSPGASLHSTESPKLKRLNSHASVKPSVSPGLRGAHYDSVVHKRSASDDLYQGPLTLSQDGDVSAPGQYSSSSLKEPLNMSALRRSPTSVGAGVGG